MRHRLLPIALFAAFLGLTASREGQATILNVDRIDDDAAATGCDDAVSDDCSLRGGGPEGQHDFG